MSDSLTRAVLLRRSAELAALAGLGPAVFEAVRADIATAATEHLEAAPRGGTLTVAMAGDPKTMDPHRTTLAVFYTSIKFTVFDSLVRLDQNLRFVPSLAQSWTVSPDGKTVTFRLREGVTFHDGTPFTAADVAFTVSRIKAKATASQFAPQVATVRRVDVRDPLTAVFHLTAPTPALLAQLLEVQIVSKRSIGSIERRPIGTGPFRFVQWAPGNQIRLQRNPRYFIPGLPRLDAIVYKPIPDPQVRLTNLRTGTVHMVDAIEAKDVGQVRGFPNVKVIASKPTVQYEMLQINTKRKPFDDKRVRQALAWAFDRQAYDKSFWAGLARPSVNSFVKEYPSYLPGSDRRYGFDLDRAKALLAQAGLSSSKPLTMEILNPSGYSTLHAASLLYQDNLGKLGHKVSVRDLEISAWIDRIATHPDFDVTTDVYGMRGPDPVGLFNSDNLSPKSNINQFNPPRYAKLVNDAATEPNPRKRNAAYRRLQAFLLDEMPMVVFVHAPQIVGASQKVSGFRIGPTGYLDAWVRTSLAA
jgi:peptide/nickel transport system substrate-binding protein